MSIRPFRDIKRRKTKTINVGDVKVGGENPITVQSMTNTLTSDVKSTIKQIQENKSIKFKKVLFQKGVSKISIIGVGMITTPGVTFRMFQALANKKINIQVISTSEIKISVLINKKDAKKALATLHKEFKLQE